MLRAYLPMPALTSRQVASFHARVEARGPDECWPWLASRSTRGYGNVAFRGSSYRATRIAYFLATGIDPGELNIRHTCDNPPCCNPAHLLPGTQKENMADARERGRTAIGLRMASAYLSDDEVRRAHALYATGQYSMREVAEMVGAHPEVVSAIVYGKNRRYLGLPVLRGVRAAHKFQTKAIRADGTKANVK